MAIGDGTDSTAAGMALVPGSRPAKELDTALIETRDYIANGHTYWKPGTVTPAAKGGTGVTTMAALKTALGVPDGSEFVKYADTAAPGVATPNKLAAYDGAGRLATASPAAAGHAVDLGTLAAHIGTSSSVPIYNLPARDNPVTSGYFALYVNGDGRIARTPSARKYKKFIREWARKLNPFAQPLQEFQLRSGKDSPTDGRWTLGLIADDLVGTPLERFVLFIDGEPESIDYVQLLLAQNADLHARLSALEERP